MPPVTNEISISRMFRHFQCTLLTAPLQYVPYCVLQYHRLQYDFYRNGHSLACNAIAPKLEPSRNDGNVFAFNDDKRELELTHQKSTLSLSLCQYRCIIKNDL
jgi:hypothetical protein